MHTTWSCMSRVKLYYIRVHALSIMISRVSRLIVVSSVIPQAGVFCLDKTGFGFLIYTVTRAEMNIKFSVRIV